MHKKSREDQNGHLTLKHPSYEGVEIMQPANRLTKYQTRKPYEPSPMYSADDLALIFNCSSRHIRRLVFRGDFPKPVKIGRLSRWPRPTVEHWFTEKVGLPDMQGELAK